MKTGHLKRAEWRVQAFSRAKTLAQGGFTSPCAFQITHGFQKEKTRFACLFFLEVTPRFELLGHLSCGVRSCSHALFFKAFVLLRGMRWWRQIIGVGGKIGGNFAAAKAPLRLAAWGKFFLCERACGFRREGVKLSEVGGGCKDTGARRSAQPCAQGWMVYGRRSPFFQLSFSLNFRSLCARVDRGRETRPPRARVVPCAYPLGFFSLVVGNGGALGLAAFFLFPFARGGIVSRARAALAVMIARRGRLRKVSAQISPLPVLKLYFTTSGKTGLRSSPVALDSAAEIARDHSGAAIGT